MSFCKNLLCCVLAVLMLSALTVPVSAEVSDGETVTVKVGYLNYPGFIKENENGDIVGYAVEYLAEICKYTNWKIEYVYAPWSEQLEMLDSGELDIVFGQFSEDRISRFGFSHLPVAVLQNLLYKRDDNTRVIDSDPSTYSGKRIGVLSGSRNIELLRSYAELTGFDPVIVEYMTREKLGEALLSGEIDILAGEQTTETEGMHVLARFSSVPYYCYTAKSNAALTNELNYVLSKINSISPNYQPSLYQKYYGNVLISEKPYFTKDESKFIENCGEITVALIPDAQPCSYTDEDGCIKGIIPDIMENISELSGISFKYVFLPTDKTPIEYLRENPTHIVSGALESNPLYKSPDVIMTAPYYNSYSAIAVDAEKARGISIDTGRYAVGVTESCQGMRLYIYDRYPNLDVVSFHTVPEGLQALSSGKIDLFAYDMNSLMPHLGNPRFGDISIIENNFMKSAQCTVGLVNEANGMLFGIIDKCISVISDDTVAEIEKEHLKLNVYRYNQSDMLYRYRSILLFIGMLALFAFAALITTLWIFQRRYTRMVVRQAERDQMTGIYNRETFKTKIRQALQKGGITQFALVLVDIDNLKLINDTFGHAAGDEAIMKMAEILGTHFGESGITARIGGDEFSVFIGNVESKEALSSVLEGMLEEMAQCFIADGRWNLGGSIGVVIEKPSECDFDKLYRHADQALYRVKNAGKNAVAFYNN